ncbi:MAG: GNAT family N-acetyltransferase [Bradymonadales bacterium]|nr:GNAT family N-acetyltransferase [Bradymonadales bacterium]
MTDSPQIRFAQPEDFPAIVELGADVFTPYGCYRETILNWLNTAGIRSLVACRQESFCGAVIFGFFNEEDHFVTEVLAVEVAGAYRRTGVGRALMRAMIGHVTDISQIYPVLSLRLSTAETNHPALSLFGSLGFRPTGEDAGRYDGGQRIIRMEYGLPQTPATRAVRRFVAEQDS